MTKVKIIGSSGSVRSEDANLCLSSGIVKFKNAEGKQEFTHITAFAIQGSRLIEVEKAPVVEPVQLTPDEPRFIEEDAGQKPVISKSSETQSAPTKKNHKKK